LMPRRIMLGIGLSLSAGGNQLAAVASVDKTGDGRERIPVGSTTATQI